MRKFLPLFLLGAALVLSAQSAWALPWEGWVTTSQTYTRDIYLGRTLSFYYESIDGNPIPDPSGDLLQVAAGGQLVGQVTDTATYPNWKSVTFAVPDSLVFSQQQLVFSTTDLGARTDPRWVFSGVTSPIPEPATLVLLGGRLAGWAALRKKRKS